MYKKKEILKPMNSGTAIQDFPTQLKLKEESEIALKSNRTLIVKLNRNYYFKLNSIKNIFILDKKYYRKNISLNYNLNAYLFNLKKINKRIYVCISILRALKISNLDLIELNYSSLLNASINYLCIKNQNFKCLSYNLIQPKIKLNTIDLTLSFYNYHQSILILKSTVNLHPCTPLNTNWILQKNTYMFYFTFIKQYSFLNKIPNKNKMYIVDVYAYKFLISILFSRKINTLTPLLLNFFLLKIKKNPVNLLKILLWKNMSKTKSKPISSSYFYYINRLHDKLDSLKNNTLHTNESYIKKLNNIRNLLYIFLDKKESTLKSKYGLIRNVRKTRDFKALKWFKNLNLFLKQKKNKKLNIQLLKKNKSNVKQKITTFKLKELIFYLKNIIVQKKIKNSFKKQEIQILKNKIKVLFQKQKITIFNLKKIKKLTYKLNVKLRKRIHVHKKIKQLKKILQNLKLEPIKTINNILKFKKNRNIVAQNKIFQFKSKKKRWKKKRKFIFNLNIKKLVSNHTTFNYKYNQELISLLFGFKINIYFINALSFTRYDLHIQQEKKKHVLRRKRSSFNFMNQLEREFTRRYKFVANYLQDFARIGIISLYMKDLSFLVKFIAFQVQHLQKNRKETKLIRFIIKAIKIFSAQREEVLALKVEFKGRVNRWRRTKIIKGTRGVIPYNSYVTRIEYATATAVTRKGALGIRLWVQYNMSADTNYARYIKVNKILKYKQFKTKFLTKW